MQTRYYLSQYEKLLKAEDRKLLSYKNPVIRLFKIAGIEDNYIPHVEAVGFGKLSSGHLSIFANFGSDRGDVTNYIYNYFMIAIGEFRSGLYDAINPFYWSRVLIYLPSNLFIFIGIKKENIIIKIINAIYWVCSVLGTIVLALYPNEIKDLLR